MVAQMSDNARGWYTQYIGIGMIKQRSTRIRFAGWEIYELYEVVYSKYIV